MNPLIKQLKSQIRKDFGKCKEHNPLCATCIINAHIGAIENIYKLTK